jgi:hypothetical protein
LLWKYVSAGKNFFPKECPTCKILRRRNKSEIVALRTDYIVRERYINATGFLNTIL